MNNISQDELSQTVKVLSSTIVQCEKAQLKFKEGSSQHSLLKNRIKALYIAKSLIINGDSNDYNIDDLMKALPPISSIISKCEKAQSKFAESNTNFRRFQNIITPMKISKDIIEKKIEKLNR